MIDQEMHKGWLYYGLKEFRSDFGYDAELFIPLSEVDEVQLAEEKEILF